MKNKKKSLCKIKRHEIEDDLHAIKLRVNEPAFICRKCARVANKADDLCKPEDLNT